MRIASFRLFGAERTHIDDSRHYAEQFLTHAGA